MQNPGTTEISKRSQDFIPANKSGWFQLGMSAAICGNKMILKNQAITVIWQTDQTVLLQSAMQTIFPVNYTHLMSEI